MYRKTLTTHNSMWSLNHILKTFNYIRYKSLNIFYVICSVFIAPFQRKFINMYSAYLHANRLPFRILSKNTQSLLIYISNIDSWILFFKRIKNHANLYIIREAKYPFVHRFWTLYFREQCKYFYELNIHKQNSKLISNFYYYTRINNTDLKSRIRHKLIFFYYIDKIALNHYPYFYWTYATTYNKYFYHKNALKNSQHMRSKLLFFIARAILATKQNKISFHKLTFRTFKGTVNALRYISIYKPKFVVKRAVAKDNIFHPIEHRVHIPFKQSFQIYNKFVSAQEKLNDYKFYINTIVEHSVHKFIKKSVITITYRAAFLKINWFTKVHNSVVNPIKQNLVLYLRAAKHFNKGRYSRNRQLYRTGVYWCIWLNVVIVYGLHYYFYRVVFAFGYLWFPLAIMALSMLSSRLYKYRFYSLDHLIQEFKEFDNFGFAIFLNTRVWAVYCYNRCKDFVTFLRNYLDLGKTYLEDYSTKYIE